MLGTRAAPRCCGAAIELPLAAHRYSELSAAYTRLEQDNTYLRSELSKVTERKKVLSAALSEKTGTVSYMTPVTKKVRQEPGSHRASQSGTRPRLHLYSNVNSS